MTKVQNRNQIVFIDDSGDPGFKLNRGSSSHFIISCVIFDDELEAEKTAITIKEFRRKIKKTDRYEFKFNKCSKNDIKVFLLAISKHDFRIRAIVVDKKKVISEELKNKVDSFYNYFIKLVLEHNGGKIKNAKIRLDGHGNRVFRREATTYLRNNLNTKNKRILRDFKFRDSKRDVLVQLADMVAGSISRKYQVGKSDKNIYWNIIKSKCDDLWEFK